MPGHTYLNDNINLKKPSTFISRQKINFILHVFPEILQRYCKLSFFGTLGLSGYVHPKWYYYLVKNFFVYLQAKINFIPHAFMEILQRYANLFWVLWAWLITLTQNDSITLMKTSMFISLQKIIFIMHFFLTILHFKKSCNMIGCNMICWWNINNNISFHYRLFPRKTNMTKFFKKYQKPYFGAILGPFCPNLGQKCIFLQKRALSVL